MPLRRGSSFEVTMRRISLLTFIFVSLAGCSEAEIEKEIAHENVESLQRGSLRLMGFPYRRKPSNAK